MTARTARPLALAAILLTGAIALSGCGKTGELERPAPLYGKKAQADYEAQKQAKAAAKAKTDAARERQNDNDLLDPSAPAPAQAPYAPPLTGRTDPLGPGPNSLGGSSGR